MYKLEMDIIKFYMWGTYDQVEIKLCRVVGQVRRGLEVRDIINSIYFILYFTLCVMRWFLCFFLLQWWRVLALAFFSIVRWEEGVVVGRETCWRGSRLGVQGFQLFFRSRTFIVVMRAVFLLLSFSDRRKDTLYCGDSFFTVWCMILEKLKKKKRVGRGS